MAEPPITLSLIIPTRNERENVGHLIERLEGALAGISTELVFVDDSDDGTQHSIAEHKGRLSVQVIHRQGVARRGGLSTAVVQGISAAKGIYVCVMDGDLQHPPEKVPELVATAERTGADMVLASRRRKGGSSAGLEGPQRKLISFALEWFTRLAFYDRLRGVDDPLSGFFLIRRTALEGVDLRPQGYKISLEVLVRCQNLKLEQVPYTFMPRPSGDSKADLKTGFTFLRHIGVLLLEVPEARRFWKFGLVGASGLGVYLLLLWLLAIQAGLPQTLGWAVAVEAAVIWNFLLNRSVTWSDRRASRRWPFVLEALRYHATSAVSVSANALVFFLLTLADVHLLAAGFASIWAGVAANYFGADRFVFRQNAWPKAARWLPWPRSRSSSTSAVQPEPALMPDGDEETL